jgi:hypothetical protein
MEWIKSIDLFGTEFQFTIYRNDRFKTVTGGLLSFIFTIFIIFFIFYEGRDLYLRERPMSYVQDVTNENGIPARNLTYDDMVLAWRLYDAGFVSNKSSRIFVHFQFGDEFIPSKKCDEIPAVVANEYFWGNKSKWWCVDWDAGNYNISADTTDLINYSLKIFVSNCDHTGNVTKCRNITTVADYMEKNFVSLELFIPTYKYNDKNPYKKTYNYQYQKFDFGNQRTDKLFFSNVNFTDDRGWLFPDEDTKNFLSYMRTESSFLFTEDVVKFEYVFYKLLIYLDNNTMIFTRRFQKVPEFFAQVGGIANFLLLAFRILVLKYNIYKRKEYLFNDLFEYVPIDHEKYLCINYLGKTMLIKN